MSKDARKLKDAYEAMIGRDMGDVEVLQMEAAASVYFPNTVIAVIKSIHKKYGQKKEAQVFSYYSRPLSYGKMGGLRYRRTDAGVMVFRDIYLLIQNPLVMFGYSHLSNQFLTEDFPSSKNTFIRFVHVIAGLGVPTFIGVCQHCQKLNKTSIYYLLAVAESKLQEIKLLKTEVQSKTMTDAPQLIQSNTIADAGISQQDFEDADI